MKSLMDQYSKEEFEKIILSCSSYTECLKELGYNSYSGASIQRLKDKIKEYQIDTSHFVSKPSLVRDEDNIFIKDSTACQKVLRNWYKKGNYSDYVCSICGQEPFWNGKELTLILDHINGYNKDDRLENLRWVCPNCNQQLDTTNGKNKNHKEHKINLCIDCGTPMLILDTSQLPPVTPVLKPYFSQAIWLISLSFSALYSFEPFSLNTVKQCEFHIVGVGYNILMSSFT